MEMHIIYSCLRQIMQPSTPCMDLLKKTRKWHLFFILPKTPKWGKCPNMGENTPKFGKRATASCCISGKVVQEAVHRSSQKKVKDLLFLLLNPKNWGNAHSCLLYTSDAADE